MAEKLSWSELRRALAVRAGVSEKTAGAFLNGLVNQLINGLKSDKQVKINGLGTFKLQAVAPRKSVNVSTGEEIIIEGYNKIVFSPEAGLKELVESRQPSDVSLQPLVFSDQPNEGDFPIDPIKKLGEQADEIVGLLAEIDSIEEPKEEPKEPEVVIPETPEEEPKVVVPEEEPKVVIPELPEIPKEPEVVTPEEEPEIIVQRPKKPEKKKYHFFRDVLICVLILLLLLAGGYFFLRSQLSGILESLLKPEQEQTEQVESPQIETPTPTLAEGEGEEESPSQLDLIPEGDIPQAQILDEFNAISAGEELEEPYSDLITTEPMHEGSRLTWMAKRFYGDKRFWPYLYDANRDRISNPSNIEIGTPIRVPRLTQAQLDTTNRASMEALDKLRIEAEAACKK
ncbi:MAG: HU family DNA-binding protein [Paludibacteraceae bacterium]|nr:HU family DNA-binding protein [Paludibacteraceae bacterium]